MAFSYILLNSISSVLYSVLFLLFVDALAVFNFINVIKTNITNFAYSSVIGLVVYGVFWITYSLVADSKVSKLANEFISGVFVLTFTIASYFISTLSSQKIIQWLANEIPENKQIIIQIGKELELNGISLTLALNLSIGIFLPFIGFSAISIILVNFKEYWREKYSDKCLSK